MKRFRCVDCKTRRIIKKFYKNDSPKGHNSRCIQCYTRGERERYKPHEPRILKTLKDGKAKCSTCPEKKSWKPISEFHKSNSTRGYQSKCKECQRKYQKVFRIKEGITATKKKVSMNVNVKERPCLGNCGKWKMTAKAWTCRNCLANRGRTIQREITVHG